MKWTKQKRIFAGVLFIVLVCGGAAAYVFTDMNPTPVQSAEQVDSKIDKHADKLAKVDLSSNPFPVGSETVTEDQIQKYLHGMSHQKVEAKDKWIHFEITEERILYLMKQIESNRSAFGHADLYLDILSRWLEGDYSKADRDHNAVWNLQGGTIGKATGVLSEAEEAQYLEENKEDKK
ncbi:DUF6241 domain-containing protein [Metabacillus sp. cB07]|uniref:DUF6241 domain-containing protein n=1 Tax=Metabacillus sp. cB07 TaxID=2806989 RepID=UPI00193AA64A|nr:DUF6241 domain-containing protein [Metabacillus sp. cB07]